MLESDYDRPEASPFGHLVLQPPTVQRGTQSVADPSLLAPARTPRDEIERQARLQGVPPNIALAVAHHRSGLSQPARTEDGSAGLFLIHPDEAHKLNIDASDWRQNARAGVTQLLRAREASGSWATALEGEHGAVAPIVHSLQRGQTKLPRGDSGIIHVSAPLPTRPIYLADFGPRKADSHARGDFHTGVDVAAPAGTPVAALTGGRAVFAGDAPGAGNSVVIRDPGGRYWAYAHLGSTGVEAGDLVRPGHQVGAVGATGFATGNHVHIGVIVRGKWANPVQVVQRAFAAGWGSTKRDTVADTDFNPPDRGGARVGGRAQAEQPDAYSITGEPSTAGAWRDILLSGDTSPEVRHLAEKQGVTL